MGGKPCEPFVERRLLLRVHGRGSTDRLIVDRQNAGEIVLDRVADQHARLRHGDSRCKCHYSIPMSIIQDTQESVRESAAANLDASLAARLRAEREARSWSLSDLASRSG